MKRKQVVHSKIYSAFFSCIANASISPLSRTEELFDTDLSASSNNLHAQAPFVSSHFIAFSHSCHLRSHLKCQKVWSFNPVPWTIPANFSWVHIDFGHPLHSHFLFTLFFVPPTSLSVTIVWSLGARVCLRTFRRMFCHFAIQRTVKLELI